MGEETRSCSSTCNLTTATTATATHRAAPLAPPLYSRPPRPHVCRPARPESNSQSRCATSSFLAPKRQQKPKTRPFTWDRFGSHLGLVIEFRADSSSSGSEAEQFLEAGEVGSGDVSGTEDCQLDTILALLASQDLDSNSAVVEAVWQQISDSGASMERLVAALLQELSRVKLEHGHLEAALATKTDQFNQQVSRLYEELEAQISGEQAKAAQEQRQRGARVLATLEEEVAERDAALRALEEEQQGLRQRLEQAAAGEVAARQDNLRLEQHLKRLEEDLMQREAEVEELMQALDIHRRNTKNEKRRRAQQAFKVTEGIARERESLVTQLDLLRTINTQLRDEQDQIMPWSLRTRERVDLIGGGEEDNSSQSSPPPDLRGIACTSPPPRPIISLPLLTTNSSFHRVKTATPSPPLWYSSSLVIFQPHAATISAKPLHITSPVKPLHTTTHFHMVHHTLHTHHTHHTFHTSFTYFHPDISATATRHTKSTQSIEHYTPQQSHTPPQQTTQERYHVHMHQRKYARSISQTSSCNPTTPQEPVLSQHDVTQHHSTSHESLQQSQEAELHYNEIWKLINTTVYSDSQGKHNNTQGQHDDGKKHSDTKKEHNYSKKHRSTQEKPKHIQENFCNTQIKQCDIQEKYINAQEKHSDDKKDSSKQQKHCKSLEKHNSAHEKHSNAQEKHNNRQVKYISTQKKYDDTQEEHSYNNQNKDTQKRQSETQEKHGITKKHSNIEKHNTEQHSSAEYYYFDVREQHTGQHRNTEIEHNSTEQYMESQEQHTKKLNIIYECNNTQKQGKSFLEQQNQTSQHTDTTQEDINNTQRKTQEQNNAPFQKEGNPEQQLDRCNIKHYNTDTQEPIRQRGNNTTGQTVTNSHPQHINNTLQTPLITNQSVHTIENTRKEITDTGSGITDGVAKEDTVKDKTLISIPEDTELEAATSSSSSRQVRCRVS
ncbi:EF-hand calcium-binding domain-containing protein 4A [Portunus trituberculatus]|uniref:EF-hand calcium-binding domain-containing protein 4A n=1 Tax=Portunus trituberculatus TaxID=210409 RepID=A0A5B7DAY2_PORTR|nr:EF-hand calcium-binding domain-containing protein 4A [Portunus trituberculatus]